MHQNYPFVSDDKDIKTWNLSGDRRILKKTGFNLEEKISSEDMFERQYSLFESSNKFTCNYFDEES